MPKITFKSLKTVAEQSAFEFGQRVRSMGLGIEAERTIASKYAFAHQYAAFPRSDDGYSRLRAAFCAGAGITIDAIV